MLVIAQLTLMEFAREYPVRDSMRMMRLLYRLSLGSNERKQEQLLTFLEIFLTFNKKQENLDIKKDSKNGKQNNDNVSFHRNRVMILLIISILMIFTSV